MNFDDLHRKEMFFKLNEEKKFNWLVLIHLEEDNDFEDSNIKATAFLKSDSIQKQFVFLKKKSQLDNLTKTSTFALVEN